MKPIRLPSQPKSLILETRHLRWEISTDGKNLAFVDKKTGKDYCAPAQPNAFAWIKKAGGVHPATDIGLLGDLLDIKFGQTGRSVKISVKNLEDFLVLEVQESGASAGTHLEGVEELNFCDISLATDDSYSACVLSRNLKTRVSALPGPSSRLQATCFPRFGFGAAVSVIGCAPGVMRETLKKACSDAKEIPSLPTAGPWGLDAAINKGSYLFNFSNLNEANADAWIALARELGANQIDMHGGDSFRWGDFKFNPAYYPRGESDVKAVIAKLHAAGIKVGLHTYAFFVDKKTAWVSPQPHPDLAKDAIFTLASDVLADVPTVPVGEDPSAMSTVTGYAIPNSVTLQIEGELITYSSISQQPPYSFGNCVRGACGTKASAHPKGAKVRHLMENFGCFLPEGDSQLFLDVAAKTAETYNACGFDMIYLDALDASGMLAGWENAWHYSAKFAYEVARRCKQPPLMEMSIFFPNLWFVRSRAEAWDYSSRAHKSFLDKHGRENGKYARAYLPMFLGWNSINAWCGPQGERTFDDDIEYLCAKCVGYDAGFAMVSFHNGSAMPGLTWENLSNYPYLKRMGGILKTWGGLRDKGFFSDAVKAKLREPGQEVTLETDKNGQPRLRQVSYSKHRVELIPGGGSAWKVNNDFEAQVPGIRIEALCSAASYESPDSVVLASFASPATEFSLGEAAPGISAKMESSDKKHEPSAALARYSAKNANPAKAGSWCKAFKRFPSPPAISGHEAMGLWIFGDGQGETLNFQLRNPEDVLGGMGEHYVKVDFEGWKYFELVEPEAEHYRDFDWPYAKNYQDGFAAYKVYRFNVNYATLSELAIWYNNVPAGKTAACHLGSIKALKLADAGIQDCAVTVNGRRLRFPVALPTGAYLEFRPPSDCRVFSPEGNLIAEPRVEGEPPMLKSGENSVEFRCASRPGIRPRAQVTLISLGSVL